MTTMSRLLLSGLIAAATTLGAAAQAQTLRFASQGDPQTMDPHSQNESFTNSVNQQVYEYLIDRDRQLNFVPGLALSWEQVSPLKWRFKLRQGVKFHDGSSFNADDVVFSVIRAQQPTSQIAVYANAAGTPRKVDDFTVEFDLPKVNPIFLEHVQSIFILDKEWCEAHKATKPQDFKNKEEAYTALNANGTGPYILVKREPGIKTTWKRNPNHWAKPQGNVQEVVFTPIGNDATRTAALVSGELDFILDPPPRDVARLRNTSGVKIIDGPENRIVFIGMDQFRDELQNSNVKGKNPFKDVRVRRALYHAVDIETMKTKLMNGQSFPTGGMTPSPKASFNDPKIEARLPYDIALAKRLMAEAGYPNGFSVGLSCPNERYVYDENVCLAVVSMLAKLGVKIEPQIEPTAKWSQRLNNLDVSMYMIGHAGLPTADAYSTLSEVIATRGGGMGGLNAGRYSNPKFDDLLKRIEREVDSTKREAMIRDALLIAKEDIAFIPLHQQPIVWAAKKGVDMKQAPDNRLRLWYVTMP